MALRQLPDADTNDRVVPFIVDPAGARFLTVRRDFVKPVPEGTYVAMIFRVTGYEPDCDGSAMGQFAAVNRHGDPTGWEPRQLGLYADSLVVLDKPSDLHDLTKA